MAGFPSICKDAIWIAVIKFSLASVLKSPIGNCDPVKITGFDKFSNIKLIADIAKSLLIARWKQTLVAAVGVTFSITMFITLLSFMSGLNEMLDNLILNRSPHIKLFNEIKASKVQPIELADKYKGSHHFIRSIKPGAVRLELHIVQFKSNQVRLDLNCTMCVRS